VGGQPRKQRHTDRLDRDHPGAADPLDARDVRPRPGDAGSRGLQSPLRPGVDGGLAGRRVPLLGSAPTAGRG
jgi:hypothetical protein